MKKEKVEELWDKYTIAYDVCRCDSICCHCEPVRDMDKSEFTQAINQAELEWYKRLEKKLCLSRYAPTWLQTVNELEKYHIEIQNKIKELEVEK